MDIKHLTWFIETVKEKSINKAAEKLFITPSALSARLVKIEDEVDCKLLTRSHNGIELTTEGQYFYEDACKICDLQSGWSYLHQRKNMRKEKITIASFPTVYNTIIPQLVARLTTVDSPYDIFSYQWDILKIESAFYKKKIRSGITAVSEGDFSSLDIFAKNLNLQIRSLGSDQFGVYVAEGNPYYERDHLYMDELSKYHHVTTFNPSFKKMGLNQFNSEEAINIRGQQNQVAYLVDHPVSCYGTYPAMFQQSLLAQAAKLHYIPIVDFSLPITYVLLYAKNAFSANASEKIVKELEGLFKEALSYNV